MLIHTHIIDETTQNKKLWLQSGKPEMCGVSLMKRIP